MSDFVTNLKDVTFAGVAASAEAYIADHVFNHVQRQSLGFHLSRETGKIIRIVSKGSQSFSNALKFSLFNIAPMFLELGFVLIILGVFYNIWFFAVTLASVLLYLVDTFLITNWRAKQFRDLTKMD